MHCQGHQGKCKFCQGEEAPQRSINGMKRIDRDGNPIFDFCCKTCGNNHEHNKKKFDVEMAARFHTNIPRGDE